MRLLVLPRLPRLGALRDGDVFSSGRPLLRSIAEVASAALERAGLNDPCTLANCPRADLRDIQKREVLVDQLYESGGTGTAFGSRMSLDTDVATVGLSGTDYLSLSSRLIPKFHLLSPFLLLLVSSLRRVRRSLQTGSLNRDRSGRAGKASEPKTYEDCSVRTRQDLYYRSPLVLMLVCWSPEAFSLSAPNAADARNC